MEKIIGEGLKMTVHEYTKDGEKIDKMKIDPAAEVQEMIDSFWNSIRSRAEIPKPNSQNLQV